MLDISITGSSADTNLRSVLCTANRARISGMVNLFTEAQTACQTVSLSEPQNLSLVALDVEGDSI